MSGMARPERFELPAFWFVARRSIQLSYGRENKILAHRVRFWFLPQAGSMLFPGRPTRMQENNEFPDTIGSACPGIRFLRTRAVYVSAGLVDRDASRITWLRPGVMVLPLELRELRNDLACRRAQDNPGGAAIKVKEPEERAGLHVIGISADAWQLPIVFDESNDGRLIRHPMVDVIALGIARDDDQGQAWPITAAAGIPAYRSRPAGAGAGKFVVHGAVRLIDDGVHLVVVPSVGIVVGDDDRGVVPVLAALDGVHNLDQPGLLVQGIGISG